MAYCAYCKTHIFNRNQKCPNCGGTVFLTDDEPAREAAPQPAPQPAPQVVYVKEPVYQTVYVDRPVRAESSKSWLAALLLCLFLGGIGAHRFYVGKVGTGILFLLTAGWGGIGWLIDFIMIATGAFRDSDGLPLAK